MHIQIFQNYVGTESLSQHNVATTISQLSSIVWPSLKTQHKVVNSYLFGKILQWDTWAWVFAFGKLLNWKLFPPNIVKLFRLSIWHLLACHMLESKLLNSKLLNFVMKTCLEQEPHAWLSRSLQELTVHRGWDWLGRAHRCGDHRQRHLLAPGLPRSQALPWRSKEAQKDQVDCSRWHISVTVQCLAQSSSISDSWPPSWSCILDFMEIFDHVVKLGKNGSTPGP